MEDYGRTVDDHPCAIVLKPYPTMHSPPTYGTSKKSGAITVWRTKTVEGDLPSHNQGRRDGTEDKSAFVAWKRLGGLESLQTTSFSEVETVSSRSFEYSEFRLSIQLSEEQKYIRLL